MSIEFRPFKPDEYSPLLQLGFQAIKWFFLFMTGFAIACVISVCLGTPEVISILQMLASKAFGPLAVLTFCIVAVVAVLESLR